MASGVPDPQQARQTLARFYGAHPAAPGERQYLDRHIGRYLKTLAALPRQPGALLDAGAFPGHLSLLAARMGWSVTGLGKMDGTFVGRDFEQRMRENGIEALHADLERDPFPFPDDQFDAVFFNETAEHLAYNPYHALDQIWRTLKPNGTLVFSVPNLASFDHRWALLKGRTIYPLLTEPLGATFHADIAQRHIREYTLSECRYLLTGQDKYLYSFAIRKEIMDRSWDGLFHTEHGYRRQAKNVRIGTVLRDVLTRIFPRCRSNILIQAVKPPTYVRMSEADLTVEGFYPEEMSGTGDSFVRRPLEACWMKTNARIAIRLPASGRRVARIELLLWLPAPASLPPLPVRATVGSAPAAELAIAPSPEPRRYSIPVPPEQRACSETLLLDMETPGWIPAQHGLAADTRTLGMMTHLKHIALVYES